MQVAEVEDVVNDKINKRLPVHAYVAPLDQVRGVPNFFAFNALRRYRGQSRMAWGCR